MRPSRSFLLLLVVGALGYGGVTLWNSPLFELEKVEISGNQRIQKEDVVAAAKLSKGIHLFDVPRMDVERRVEALAWVAEADVERVLPSTVRIRVREREPVAAVVAQGRTWLVDIDGVVLEEGAGAPVQILDLPLEEVVPGDRIAGRPLSHALGVYRSLPPPLGARVRALRAASVDRVTLVLDGGVLILYGGNEATDEKNFAVLSLLEKAESEGRWIEYIDVRVPSRPATRP